MSNKVSGTFELKKRSSKCCFFKSDHQKTRLLRILKKTNNGSLQVTERPIISSPLATERIFSSGDQNKTLDCEAEGYPLPSVTWLKNGILIKSGTTEIIHKSSCNVDEFCSQKMVSSLHLKNPLHWLDKGNFTCLADNNPFGPKTSSWTILRVLHKPVILRKVFSGISISAVDVGSRAIIPCKVSARPEPEFHWLRNGLKLIENEKYSFYTSASSEVPDEYEQRLQIESVQDEDFGDYVCRATNGNGGDNATIELRKKSLPFVPKDLQKLSSTAHSIRLSWNPQFDGGFNQTFTLEARKVDPLTGNVPEDVPSTVLTLKNSVYSEEIEVCNRVIQFLEIVNFDNLQSCAEFRFPLSVFCFPFSMVLFRSVFFRFPKVRKNSRIPNSVFCQSAFWSGNYGTSKICRKLLFLEQIRTYFPK